MIDLPNLIDDAECSQTARDLRWPEGVTCPYCSSPQVIKDGKDDTQPHRQRYDCRACGRRFDDLTGIIFAGHNQLLQIFMLCLYLIGLNLSSLQIAKELGLHRSEVQEMTTKLRQEVVERQPEVTLSGEVECAEVYAVAGHQGNPEAVKKPTTRKRAKNSVILGVAPRLPASLRNAQPLSKADKTSRWS